MLSFDPTRPPRTRPRAIAAFVAVLAALLLAPSPAIAHDSVVSSYPAASSSVDSVPDEISITFSAELLGEGGTGVVQVTGPDGVVYSEGDPEIADATITQHLASDAPGGAYTVLWRVVSSDGHPTSGEYGFEIRTSISESASSTPTTTAEPSPSPTSTSSQTALTDSGEQESRGESTDVATAVPLIALTIVGVAVIVSLIVVLALRGARRRGEDRS